MRVLLVGSAHPWRMEMAVAAALGRAGHTVLVLDDRRLKRRLGHALTQRWVVHRARRFAPDRVILSKCHALALETVAQLVARRPAVMWYHDAAYFRDAARPDIAHVVAVGQLAGTFFVTGFEDEWRALGLNAHFLPAAGNGAIRPVPPDPRYAAPVSFIGTGYDASRAEFLVALSARLPVRVWGTRWEPWADRLAVGGRAVEGRDFAAVCASSRISLGILPTVMRGASNASSDRVWMVMLAGGFYLGPYTTGLARMLIEGEHCAWYPDGDVDACARVAARYLADDDLRERVRTQGERFVRAHHTYDQRLGSLLTGEPWVNPLEAGRGVA